MKFSTLSIENLFKKYSKYKVSKNSILEIKKILENEIDLISISSKEISQNAKRKTIKESDVKISLYKN